jgi:hypothetical protein
MGEGAAVGLDRSRETWYCHSMEYALIAVLVAGGIAVKAVRHWMRKETE